MENLNAEQIKKALEQFHHRILNTKLAEKVTESEIIAVLDALSLITSQEQRIGELEVDLKAMRGAAYSYKIHIVELTEENEKLLTALANYNRLTDVRIAEEYYTAEAYEELREENERLRASSVDYRNIPYIKAEVRADTVRKMQERLKARKFTHKNFGELVYVEDIDQIAKEMEGVCDT